MADIVGVKFKNNGKLYYFDPGELAPAQGSKVIVETAQGMECGEIVLERRDIPDDQLSHELKSVVREATEADLRQVEENAAKEERAFGICEEKIAAHELEMKLVSVEYAFDGSKILFNFTADGRVDFRELVKDLAGVFRTRIELRQIGVRDEAKMLGGLGVCGRPFCCKQFMGEFVPVSIKMAKEQGLSLNPTKISGTCGRLMCCLKHEEEAYKHLLKNTPKVGTHVHTPDGSGVIIDINLLTGMLLVRMDDMPEGSPHSFHKKYVRLLDKNGQPEPVDENAYADDIARAPEEERAVWRKRDEDDFIPVISMEDAPAPADPQTAQQAGEHKRQGGNRQGGRGGQNKQGKPGGNQNKQGGQNRPGGNQNKQGGQGKPGNQNKQSGGQNKQGGNQNKPGGQNKQGGNQNKQGGQNRPNGNQNKPQKPQGDPNKSQKPQGDQNKPQKPQNGQGKPQNGGHHGKGGYNRNRSGGNKPEGAGRSNEGGKPAGGEQKAPRE